MNGTDYAQIRRQLQLSARELGRILGVSEVTIQRREAGRERLRNEHWYALDRIALAQGLQLVPAETSSRGKN